MDKQRNFKMICLCMVFLSLLLNGKPILAQDHQEGEKTVSGIVTDDKGLALIGVSVFVENTMIGVSTNDVGEYTIKMPAKNQNIVFSCIGYISQTFAVTQSKRQIGRASCRERV